MILTFVVVTGSMQKQSPHAPNGSFIQKDMELLGKDVVVKLAKEFFSKCVKGFILLV